MRYVVILVAVLLLLGVVIVEIHLFRLQKKIEKYQEQLAEWTRFLEG